MDQVRSGIVGSGFAAAFHRDALHRVYSVPVEIRGVYSPNAKHRRAFAQEANIAEYQSLDSLIDAVDVVHVCTPPATHEEVAAAALQRGRWVVIEKPYTGYFGDGEAGFHGDTFDRRRGLAQAMASVARLAAAEERAPGGARVLYAENWVYAPSIQKEREIIEKTDAQILWMHGEAAHSGSHSPVYGVWSHSGGGSVMGKAVHPLSAALYLKQVEGRHRSGRAIRPVAVSSRVHALTRNPAYRDRGFLRTGYTDIEDFGQVHVVFEDGTVADVFASEIVHGGVHNWLEVHGNNHRTVCNINPNTAMQTFNPKGEQFQDIYVVEKTETKEGWSSVSPDEAWFTGYQHEMEAFYQNVADSHEPESGSLLGADTIAVVYSAYLSAAQAGAEVPLSDITP